MGLLLRQGTSAATGHGPLLHLNSTSIIIGNNNKMKKMDNNYKKNRIRNSTRNKKNTTNRYKLHLMLCLVPSAARWWPAFPLSVRGGTLLLYHVRGGGAKPVTQCTPLRGTKACRVVGCK